VARSDDGGDHFGEPTTIVTTTDPETTMASLALDEAARPWVAWLQNSTLRLAAGDEGGNAFTNDSVVDDLVCECCQPAVLAYGDQLLVAYRNLIRDEAGQASRDIHVARAAIAVSEFAAPVQVSDGTWRIDACPIAGPALGEHAGTLYAVWMDGRFDDGTFSRTDIWLAASTDGGASFGPNVRVNATEGGYNGQPAFAVDGEGRLHVAWTAETAEGEAILYSASADGGQTFAAPVPTVTSTAGRLGNPVLAVGEAGRLYLGWTDAHGAHVMPIE
jgi:hypothetical protein